MSGLPSGTVTFLFSDIEGSTAILQRLGDRRYAEVLTAHAGLLRAAFAEGGGTEIDTQGDAFFVAFQSVRQAVAAAVAVQQAVSTYPWPEAVPVRVRMGLHTGEPVSTETAYVGLDVHRAARICAAGHGGQILLSQTTSSLVKNDLPPGLVLRDLGEHRLKDLQRPERIYQLLHPDLPEVPTPLRSLNVLPNNLPVQMTTFIGRVSEMAAVAGSLARTRLLTVTGTAGAGKTRLALQVAADLLDEYADGVWLVELATMADPALVPRRAAAALRLREESGRPIVDTLLDYLKPARALVILDNCEHLIDACARLAQTLLETCPGLKVLATSREPLNVPGELLYAVPPLAVPDLRRLPPPEALTQYEAVRLFVDRASSRQLTFRLSEATAVAVARICSALDGIPLAIELAAARTAVLSVGDIAARLGDRFRLLRGGSRTAPPRQQALEAMLDWSYDLLSDDERTLFSRLSVFRGDFTLEAVEGICGDGALMALVSKSLVVMDTQTTTARYRLLETVRAYGQARLAASGEEPAIRGRHRAWYLQWVERAEPMLATAEETWLHQVDAEQDNLRAAIESSLESGDDDAALRLASALWRFWLVRGYWTEGRQHLEAALTTQQSVPPELRAKATRVAAALAQYQGDYRRAEELGRQSLRMQRALGDRHGMALSLMTLGNVAYQQGDYAAAWELHEESLTYGRESGDKTGMAAALVNLASVAMHRGEYDRASGLGQESLGLFRETGDRRGTAFVLNLLGVLASDRGDYGTAQARFEEGLAIQRELGDRRGIERSLSSLGLVAREQADLEKARALYEESLAIGRELGHKAGMAFALRGLGAVAWLDGHPAEAEERFGESLRIETALNSPSGIAGCLEGLAQVTDDLSRAATLLGAASALRETAHAAPPHADETRAARRLAGVRSGLGEARFSAAWERGRLMRQDDAVAYALSRPEVRS